MNPKTFGELTSLSEKIAGELVFAEAGKDLGLLPVNSLLGQVEELLAAESGPEALLHGARLARSWIDGIFDTTGTFSAASLKRLGDWTAWFQSALPDCEREAAPAALPESWVAGVIAAEAAPVAAAAARVPEQEEPVMVLNLEEDGELLGEFINESQEHLQNIEQGVLVLEENPTDADTLNSIFRAFHTFKGGSGFLNLTAIQTLAHELESLLDLARQHKLAITPEVINLILAGGDTLKQFTNEIALHLADKAAPGPIRIPTLHLLGCIRDVLAAASGTGPAVAAAAPAIPVAISAPAAGAEAAPTGEILPATSAPEAKPAAGQAKAGAPASAIKVDISKLDSLIDLVGELVIAQSLVVQNPDLRTLRSEQLNRDLAQLGHISKDLQRTAMSLRMVPIRGMFQKMQRLVRDLTAKMGKQVQLVTEGEDTELDRTIVEEISDPLVHMIRNSVDHGIEKPEIRLQRGKSAQGVIWLKAYHRGGNIVVEIRDDGNGLDRGRILAKALEKGLVKPEESLSDSQIYNLIFAAGFSTAEKITDVSGRGVGLDVVRRNIDKLRGKVEILSTPGQGSTFRIYLPLTLAIIDGLLVGIGEHRYIVPTLSVCESFQPRAGMISTTHGRGEMINVRGRLIPLLRLYAHLGIQPGTTEATQSIVVVVESGKETRCLLVDQLLGKQEVVIKSLGETFRGNRYLAGAAIMGDGRVGLILDPQALVHFEPAQLEAAA
jgi:two-component system chemotaxis sensor kinase CheA